MARRETRFFALLMPWGRVGSNLMAAALSRQPGIALANEPTTRIRTDAQREGWSEAQVRRAQFDQLAAFHAEHAGRRRAAGLKLSHRSLSEPLAYLTRLRAMDFLPVAMVRENTLKCAVSQMRAQARSRAGAAGGGWRSPWAIGADEPKPGPAPLDPAEAIRLAGVFAEAQETMDRTLARVFGSDVLRVEYRDLAADPEGEVARVFAHLGLDAPERLELAHRKATSDDLSEDVTNYAEFAAAVRASPYARFLGPDA
jgi:hypothetical protein